MRARSPCSSTQSPIKPLDVVERVRALGVAGELDRAPDLVFAAFVAAFHLRELLLDPAHLVRDAGAGQAQAASAWPSRSRSLSSSSPAMVEEAQ